MKQIQNLNIHTKKISKQTKKKSKKRSKVCRKTDATKITCLEERINQLETQLAIYRDFIKEESENKSCPVTWEDFDTILNPPYLIYGCNHKISLAALKRLKIIPVKVKGKIKTTYMHCPLCNNRMLFASLDFSYFKFSNLKQRLANPQDMFARTNMESLVGDHPHFFTPIKGCLSISQYLS